MAQACCYFATMSENFVDCALISRANEVYKLAIGLDFNRVYRLSRANVPMVLLG